MPLNSWFAGVVEKFGDAPAIHTNDGDTLSFARLSLASDQIAAELQDNGISANHNILSNIDHFALNIAFWMAVWRLGGNLLASKSIDPFLRAGITVNAVFADPTRDFPKAEKTVPFSPSILARANPRFVSGPAGETMVPTVNSTRQLGVLGISPEQLLEDARLYSDMLSDPTGPVFLTTSLDSMRAFRDVIRAFSFGQAVVGPDMPEDSYWNAIINYQVTELFLTPLMLHRLLESEQRPKAAKMIRRVFIGSGTPQKMLLERALRYFGPVIELAAGTPETSVYAFKKYDPMTHETGQIGPAQFGISAEIVDEEGRKMKTGQVGRLRLCVPSHQRFRGYLGGGAAYDDDGAAFPGFLASLDENGEMTKHGRTDDRLSLGGTRYFSGKIEEALEKLPDIQSVCAIRVFAKDGAEALGLAVSPEMGGCDYQNLQELAKRSLRGIGEVIVKECPDIPKTPDGQPDRPRVEKWWNSIH